MAKPATHLSCLRSIRATGSLGGISEQVHKNVVGGITCAITVQMLLLPRADPMPIAGGGGQKRREGVSTAVVLLWRMRSPHSLDFPRG